MVSKLCCLSLLLSVKSNGNKSNRPHLVRANLTRGGGLTRRKFFRRRGGGGGGGGAMPPPPSTPSATGLVLTQRGHLFGSRSTNVLKAEQLSLCFTSKIKI